jgi:hypothetical protein
MAQIKNPKKGQLIWTVVNGEVCERIYAGLSPDNFGHLLQVPSQAIQGKRSPYYEAHLMAYEKKSEILAIHLESAERALKAAKADLHQASYALSEALLAENQAASGQQEFD